MASDSVSIDENGKEIEENRYFSMLKRVIKLKPLNSQTVYTYYIPLAGAFSYTAFSVSVFLPDVTSRMFPKNNFVVANSLLFNAHLGSGLYLYSRDHMKLAPQYYRIMYSVYGSLVFNFGSVLLWAVTKALLPDSKVVRTIFALSTSFCMLTIGKEYIDFVDSKTKN